MSSSVNPPQLLNAVLAATPVFNATMFPGVPLAYTLPIASAAVLGGIKVGANLSIAGDGTLSATGGTAPVSSVFTRTGAVVAAPGDYTAAQVTNAVDKTASYPDPAWITSLSWAKITGAPADAVPSVFGRTGAVVAQSGDYTAAQVTNAVDKTQTYSNPAWITAIAWGIISGAPTFQQNPAIADELQGGFRTLNSGNVGVGNSLATAPMTSPGNYVQVGSDSGTTVGRVMVCSNQPTSLQTVGELDFVNFASASAEKRIAYIQAQSYQTSGTAGSLIFYTAAAAGPPVAHLQIGASGQFSCGSSISSASGDYLYVNSAMANLGLYVTTTPSGGGTIALRSGSSVNMLQSGTNNNGANQEFRITGVSGSPTYLEVQTSSNVVATTCPTAASDSALVANNMVYCYINEAGNALTFRVKFSSGTIKQGTITVA